MAKGPNRRPGRVVREQIARERRRRRTIWTSIIAAAALVIAGLIGWGMYAASRAGDYTAPAGATADGSGVQVGSGPVTVDVYEDFICPACQQFERSVGPTLDRLAAEGRARIVYHPVAFLDRFSSTDYSSRSSAASGCAAQGGKFREYARALFERQPLEGGPGLSDQELVEIGTSVGLSADSFGSCLRDGTFRRWTRHVTERASEAGINATPSVLVDGKPASATAEAITAAVEAAGR